MKNRKSVFARIVAAMLALVLVFSLAACKNNDESPEKEIAVPEKKVAILVAPEEQFPEDYKAAYELAAKYPENIVVKEYPDSRILVAGNPQIMTLSEELAADPTIGTIIYARATQFTTNAIAFAKAKNPDIDIICIEPEESIDKISAASDLVLCTDWAAAAKDIVANAKEQGAKYFVVFSLNRHISENNMLANANTAIKTACEEQGISYVYDNGVDPNWAEKIKGSQKYIKEAVARLELNDKIEGSDVALFSTDSSVQSTLIEVANSKGLIYVSPSFPTAYNGAGEVYNAAFPAEIKDVKSYISSLKEAVKADTEGKARISVYKFPLAATLLESAVYCAFDMLNGNVTEENFSDSITAWVNQAADEKNFTVSAYNVGLKNAFAAYCPGFEIIK